MVDPLPRDGVLELPHRWGIGQGLHMQIVGVARYRREILESGEWCQV